MIELRDLHADDAARLYEWRREGEVDRWMPSPAPTDLDGHQRWFDAFRADPDRRGWVISLKQGPCGFLALTGLTGRHGRGEWSWYVGSAEARGRGVGRAAQALGLDRAFSELKLEKVWSEVIAGNEAALRAQAAAGFRREGYMRRHVVKGGERHDVVVLGILAEEWSARREATRADLARSGLIAA